MTLAKASLLALLVCWVLPASADVAVPTLSGRVVDQTGTLSASEVSALTQKLKDLETRKGSQVAVLIVPTTQPETIEQFSIRVAEAWKIGRRKIDDGALLVVAKNDRKLRIEVGYGLEGPLPDATARRIIDEIILPHFRNGDFTGGISAGIDRIIRIVDGEPLPAPRPEASHGADPNLVNMLVSPFGFIAFIVLSTLSRGLLGRLLGSGLTAAAVGGITWFIAGSIGLAAALAAFAFFVTMIGGGFNRQFGGGGGYGGGWSTGSSGGSWSGGSSDGGFSGGGGSFGGGGASGSW